MSNDSREAFAPQWCVTVMQKILTDIWAVEFPHSNYEPAKDLPSLVRQMSNTIHNLGDYDRAIDARLETERTLRKLGVENSNSPAEIVSIPRAEYDELQAAQSRHAAEREALEKIHHIGMNVMSCDITHGESDTVTVRLVKNMAYLIRESDREALVKKCADLEERLTKLRGYIADATKFDDALKAEQGRALLSDSGSQG